MDDTICCSCNPKDVLEKVIGRVWTIKKGSIYPSNIYLCNKVSKVSLEKGINCWTFSSAQYAHTAVNNVERYLIALNQSLPKKASDPFKIDYRPEIDISTILLQSEANYFQSLIEILRLIVELGRIDITVEVSMMFSMMAMPQKCHLKQLLHIFAYLKQKYNSETALDPTVPVFDEALF